MAWCKTLSPSARTYESEYQVVSMADIKTRPGDMGGPESVYLGPCIISAESDNVEFLGRHAGKSINAGAIPIVLLSCGRAGSIQ